MTKFIVCDQNGKPFTKKDSEGFTDKQVKKIGFIDNDFLCIEVKDYTIDSGPTPDTKRLFTSIKDNKGNIKITDVYVVK